MKHCVISRHVILCEGKTIKNNNTLLNVFLKLVSKQSFDDLKKLYRKFIRTLRELL